MAATSTIAPRNFRFATGPAVPRHWHGGRKSVTAFFDNLSVFFPAGERFFIKSVRRYVDRVGAASLRAEIFGFSAQEGIHDREHVRYNAMLAAQGYPVVEMERRVVDILRLAERVLPPRMQLAVTCGLEHFTALLAHLLLADPRLLEGADETMAELWRWHAAEENEHRSVAYDVFLAVGGTYAERVAVMFVATVIFWAKVLEHQVRMMATDGIATSAREWTALVRYLFVEPGGMGKLARLYLAYYRPSFHPRDIDVEPLLEAWRQSLERRAA
jgi:predicted metal-dependent hydrolase